MMAPVSLPPISLVYEAYFLFLQRPKGVFAFSLLIFNEDEICGIKNTKIFHCEMSFQIHSQLFRSFRDSQLISNSPLKSFVCWVLFFSHQESKFEKHSNCLYGGQCDISSILFKKNFKAPFYGQGSTAKSLQSHCKEAVYFLSLSSKKFLVPI